MEHNSSFNKQLKSKNPPSENPFDFTDYVEMQKVENEIDFGLSFELAEENKIIYNQAPVNTLIEDMEKLKNGYFTVGYFNLGDEREIDTNRFFNDGIELAKFIDKILVKYNDEPCIYYTGNTYRYFRNFKLVKRSEYGRSANELSNILKYKAENFYIPKGNGCFLKCINYNFKKNICIDFFEFIQPYKRRPNVMTPCRIPNFCERYRIDIGIYDPKSRRLPRSGKQRNKCLYIHKYHYCVI